MSDYLRWYSETYSKIVRKANNKKSCGHTLKECKTKRLAVVKTPNFSLFSVYILGSREDFPIIRATIKFIQIYKGWCNAYLYWQFLHNLKVDRIALSVLDLQHATSTPFQNQPLCQPPTLKSNNFWKSNVALNIYIFRIYNRGHFMFSSLTLNA